MVWLNKAMARLDNRALRTGRQADAGCVARVNPVHRLTRPFWLATGTFQKTTYQRHHLVELVFEGEVSGVDQMKLDFR
jgi:hypothetical protein